MLTTIMLPIGSLSLAILLLIVYKFKVKETTLENNLFNLLIVLLIFILSSEIISVFTIYYHDLIPILNEIVCRLHCLFVFNWIIVLALYLITFGKDYQIESYREYLFKNLKLKKFIPVYIILCIIFFFLKFDYVIVEDTAYLDGIALYYIYGIGIVVFILAISLLLRNNKNLSKVKKLPIIISAIESIITIPLSIKFPTIYIITSSLTFKVYLIYFLTENPDLYIIKDLEKAKLLTEESNRAKSEFLSNMSNEIRMPMNTIIGISENLSNIEQIDDKECKSMAKSIYSASNSLLETVNNIMDLSRIETNSEVIENKEYELKLILAEIVSIINARVKDNVVFNINYDQNIPNNYIGDKTKVFQILLNLLSNSSKYTEVGRITLDVSYNEQNSILRFKISDTGTGIKEEDYNKLFAKFSRLSNATDNEIEGLGLGLLITKRLVDLLEGKIWFDSKYGAGTNFYVELSQKKANEEKIGDISINSRNGKIDSYLDCSGYKVLLVDDNKLNLKVAEKLLKPYKFNIKCVTSAKDAIYSVKEGEIYDIIFLDHMMPGMDGIECMHILKKLSKIFSIPPIVCLTANAITGVKEMYLKEGFDDYLSKPINVSELNKMINKYFNKEDNNE